MTDIIPHGTVGTYSGVISLDGLPGNIWIFLHLLTLHQEQIPLLIAVFSPGIDEGLDFSEQMGYRLFLPFTFLIDLTLFFPHCVNKPSAKYWIVPTPNLMLKQ